MPTPAAGACCRARSRGCGWSCPPGSRSEEHTSELQPPCNLVCRLPRAEKTEYTANTTEPQPRPAPAVATRCPPLVALTLRPPVVLVVPYPTLFRSGQALAGGAGLRCLGRSLGGDRECRHPLLEPAAGQDPGGAAGAARRGADRKSTRLNSSHLVISYAVFRVQKKLNIQQTQRNHSRVQPLPWLRAARLSSPSPYALPSFWSCPTRRSSDLDKHSLAGLGFDALGVAWEATENADTRCWSLLPDKIQVVRLELPAGEPIGRAHV